MEHPYNKDSVINYDLDKHLEEKGFKKGYLGYKRGIYRIEFSLFTIDVIKDSGMGYTYKMGFKALYKNEKYIYDKDLIDKAIKLIDFLIELEGE